jgi:hypothetical protein
MSGEKTYYQKATWPVILEQLVAKVKYRKGWVTRLYSDLDRGQGSIGCTLVITTSGYDSYNPSEGNYRVNHYMPVPPAAYDERSWRRWLFEQFLLVERHECMEFFVIDGKRPYAPHHGPGNDCYNVFDHGTDEDKRTMYTGKVLKPKHEPDSGEVLKTWGDYKPSVVQESEENAPQPSMNEIDKDDNK